MKNLNFYKIVFLILFVTIFGCNSDSDPVGPTSSDPIISPNAKIIDSLEFANHFTSISADSSIYTFSKGGTTLNQLQANHYLVSRYKRGILRKVTNVQTTNDKIVVSTTATSITDVVQQGSGSFSKHLLPGDIETIKIENGVKLFPQKSINGELFNAPFEFKSEDNKVIVSGSIVLNMDVSLNLKVEDWRLKELQFYATPSITTEITGKCTLIDFNYTREWTLATITGYPITFFIGIFPVVITPEINLIIGADGRVHAAIESKITQVNEVSGGLKYSNNLWSPISSETHTFTFEPPTFSAEAGFKASVKPKLSILLYGVVGPYIQPDFYGDFIITAPNLNAALYAGFDLRAGVTINVFGHQIADYDTNVISIRNKIWEASGIQGKISGVVKDAVNNNPITDVEIKVYKDDINNYIKSGFTTSNGTYEISLEPYGNYYIVFSKTGYIPAEYSSISVTANGNTVLETILQINQNYSGIGSISGKILNALNANGVDGLSLKIRKGINVISGSILGTTSTSNGGNYSFTNLQGGNYTVEAGGTGYNTIYFSVIVIGGTNTGNQNATITPLLTGSEIRIILTWGELPYDLDSHTSGPLSSGERYHMYYPYSGNNSPWPTVVKLDVDDVSSYGPETTTLYQQLSGGTYRFSVHDYSNRNLTSSTALSNSSAMVRVYGTTGLIATYNIPPNHGGTLWKVFELKNGILTTLNTFDYVTDPASIDGPSVSKVFHRDNKKK